MELEVSVEIAAPQQLVWDVLTRWERQADWMRDAVRVEVVTPHREGTGVTLRVPTRIVGVTIDDVMRVTTWDPPHELTVVHLGRLIRGSGTFRLTTLGAHATRVVWSEWIDPPLGRLGAIVTRAVVVPITRRIFANSLDGLRRTVESELVRTA